MFASTFAGCVDITSVPENLFSGIKGAADHVFYSTFSECKSLTSVPKGLFAGVSGVGTGMFDFTFNKCPKLAGYIPVSTFAGLVAKGSPTVNGMWTDTFSGTNLDTTCPSGTSQYTTGYESEWGGLVSCVDYSSQVCVAGEYLPKYFDSCAVCTENNICVGGTYSFSTSADQGIAPANCTNGYHTPAGSSSVADCIVNTIIINWTGAAAEDIILNNAGQCTYGGDIRTPVKARHIPGQTFVGWTFDVLE